MGWGVCEPAWHSPPATLPACSASVDRAFVCLEQVCDVHRRLQDMSIEVRPALCLLPRCSARCLRPMHHAQKQGQVITGCIALGCITKRLSLFVSHSTPAFLNVSLVTPGV